MNPLILHLKLEYWDAIAKGIKTVEYRECKPYWQKRIRNKKEIIFTPGYKADNYFDIHTTIEKIEIVNFLELPTEIRHFFRDSHYDRFYAISFKKIDEDENTNYSNRK